jgi:hypothetical protein
MLRLKHRPRIGDGSGTHSHQGSGIPYPDDDCPECRREYLEENAEGLLAACHALIPWMELEAVLRRDKDAQLLLPMLQDAIAKAEGRA